MTPHPYRWLARTRTLLLALLATTLPASAPADFGLFGQGPVATLVGVSTQPPAAPAVEVAAAAGKTVHVSEAEMVMLATLAVLEAGSNCSVERLDVVQVVFNRLRLGEWGRGIAQVLFASGQFQPFFGISPWSVDTEAEAAGFIARQRSMSRAQALAAIRAVRRDVADVGKMRGARRFVGGRVFFKGVSQYRSRVASEDPLRHSGCNFYHIGSGQTYTQLERLEAAGPDQVLVR